VLDSMSGPVANQSTAPGAPSSGQPAAGSPSRSRSSPAATRMHSPAQRASGSPAPPLPSRALVGAMSPAQEAAGSPSDAQQAAVAADTNPPAQQACTDVRVPERPLEPAVSPMATQSFSARQLGFAGKPLPGTPELSESEDWGQVSAASQVLAASPQRHAKTAPPGLPPASTPDSALKRNSRVAFGVASPASAKKRMVQSYTSPLRKCSGRARLPPKCANRRCIAFAILGFWPISMHK
jgi:hypothetical protein